MTTISEATIDLHANVAALRSDLAKGLRETQKFQRGVQQGFRSLRNVAGALGLTVGIAELIGFGKRAVAAAGELADLAEQLRISGEELQAYGAAASEAGIGSERMALAINRLNEAIGEATGGNRQLQQAFVDLGVGFEDASGHSRATGAVLADLADAYAEAGDQTKFLADLTNVMGREAGRLGPVLEQAAGGVAAFVQEQKELGLVASDETLDTLDALGDAFERLGRQALVAAEEGLAAWTKFLGLVEPTLDEQVADLTAELAALNAQKEEFLAGGGQAGPGAMEAFDAQIRDILTRLHALDALKKMEAEPAGAAAAPPSVDPIAEKTKAIKEESSALAELLQKMQQELSLTGLTADERQRLTAMYEASAAAQKDYDAGLRDSPLLTGEEIAAFDVKIQKMQTIEQATEAAIEQQKRLKEETERAAEQEKQMLQELTQGFGDLAAGIANAALGFQDWEDVGKQAIDAIFSFLFEQLSQLETFGGPGGGLFSGLNLFGGLFSGGGGAFPGVPPGFPMAEGGAGIVRQPTLFLAGEAGPERFSFEPLAGGERRAGMTVFIDARGADKAEFARLRRALRILDASIEERAVAANLDRQRRSVAFRQEFGA